MPIPVLWWNIKLLRIFGKLLNFKKLHCFILKQKMNFSIMSSSNVHSELCLSQLKATIFVLKSAVVWSHGSCLIAMGHRSSIPQLIWIWWALLHCSTQQLWDSLISNSTTPLVSTILLRLAINPVILISSHKIKKKK